MQQTLDADHSGAEKEMGVSLSGANGDSEAVELATESLWRFVEGVSEG